MNMGEKIKQRRLELKMTQEELAEKLNVSRSSVANWEAGRNYPDLQLIASIADVLELSLDEILREDCEMIKRIAEDTKCRKKQSRKIRVLSVLLAAVLVAAVIAGARYYGGSMDAEQAQIYKGTLQIESSYNAMLTQPAPAENKIFGYSDYSLNLNFIAKDRIQQGIEFQTMETARSDFALNVSDEKITQEKVKQIDGRETYKITCSWDTDNDGEWDSFSIVTAVDAGYGIYIIDTSGIKSEDLKAVQRKHKTIVDSFQLTDAFDTEAFAEGKGQVGDFIFDLPGWDARTWYADTGKVIYSSQRDLEYIISAKPVNQLEASEENMEATVKEMYNGSLDEVTLIGQKDSVGIPGGSSVVASFHISYDGGAMDTTALFILDNEGRIVMCFTKDYDDNMEEAYSEIVDSIENNNKYLEQFANLWDGRLQQLQTVDDFDGALALISEAGFDEYGSYSSEFTEGEGIRIIYEDLTVEHDFTRDAALILALIEPLDYVEIEYGQGESDIITLDDASCIGYGNIKNLGKDEGLFSQYFWETLEL